MGFIAVDKVDLPWSHRDCWPIRKEQLGVLTHEEAIRLLDKDPEQDDGDTIVRGIN